MVTKPSTEQTQDFSIHNEDFPALPGPNYKDTTLTNNDESKAVSVSRGSGLALRAYGECSQELTRWDFFCVQNLNSTSKSTASADGPKFPGDKTSAQNNNQKKGIQVLPDGETSQPITPLPLQEGIMVSHGWGSQLFIIRQCMLTAAMTDSLCAFVHL